MYKAIVIGSGAAGLAAAVRLHGEGVTDIAVVTENILSGTSRNTGSDKQTYYKLSLGGDTADSVMLLASDLFQNGGIDGELALTEAANSARAFHYLTELGVPFPKNAFGEYIGYRTDHDTRGRATSCGPLTSRFMTEALEAEVNRRGIEVRGNLRAVRLIVENNTVHGVICVDTQTDELIKIDAQNVILATGGEASLYEQSVFPGSQWGAMGLFVEAGAVLHNMNSWQYGIASVGFRWNLSGSYQQALPRYVTMDENGVLSELLPKYLDSIEALNRVFLKGYEWPFDVRKRDGSSFIDLIVHYETTVLGHTVYLDFTKDPSGLENGFDGLSEACYSYLANCGALRKTPIERLCAINEKAYRLYLSHGIDLEKDLLKIAVCAQHQCGGARVDAHYETSVNGLFAIGEAAGVFGAYRPGGSALNSTQVGALRCAQHVAARKAGKPPAGENAASALSECLLQASQNGGIPHLSLLQSVQAEMSEGVSHIRDLSVIDALLQKLSPYAQDYFGTVSPGDSSGLSYLKTRDTLLTAVAVLSAAKLSAEEQGSSGSAFVTDKNSILTSPVRTHEDTVKQIVVTNGMSSALKEPSPLPSRELWFENLI